MNSDLLRRVMETQSASGRTEVMTNMIAAELRRIDSTITIKRKRGNLYATKGEAEVYPCVVAHTDTVHKVIPQKDFQVFEAENIWFAWDSGRKTQAGIGGDDKVGIYIALRMVEELDAVKVAFFRDEEVGCQGSGVANMQFFTDCAFVLQCDRRGYGDFVYNASGTELYGDEFQEAIDPILEAYAFKRSYGAMTDVMELKDRGLKVACANMSCGYYRPHTDDEYIDTDEVALVESMVYTMCKNLGSKQWLHDKPARKTYSRSYYTSDGYDGWDYRRGEGFAQTGQRWNSHWDTTHKRYVSKCEQCGDFNITVMYRRDHHYMECDQCYMEVERLSEKYNMLDEGMLALPKGEDVIEGTFDIIGPKEEVTAEEWITQVNLHNDIVRIRRSGPTDNDFLWAVDVDNADWPDDFKMEVVKAFYDMKAGDPEEQEAIMYQWIGGKEVA